MSTVALSNRDPWPVGARPEPPRRPAAPPSTSVASGSALGPMAANPTTSSPAQATSSRYAPDGGVREGLPPDPSRTPPASPRPAPRPAAATHTPPATGRTGRPPPRRRPTGWRPGRWRRRTGRSWSCVRLVRADFRAEWLTSLIQAAGLRLTGSQAARLAVCGYLERPDWQSSRRARSSRTCCDGLCASRLLAVSAALAMAVAGCSSSPDVAAGSASPTEAVAAFMHALGDKNSDAACAQVSTRRPAADRRRASTSARRAWRRSSPTSTTRTRSPSSRPRRSPARRSPATRPPCRRRRSPTCRTGYQNDIDLVKINGRWYIDSKQ